MIPLLSPTLSTPHLLPACSLPLTKKNCSAVCTLGKRSCATLREDPECEQASCFVLFLDYIWLWLRGYSWLYDHSWKPQGIIREAKDQARVSHVQEECLILYTITLAPKQENSCSNPDLAA